MHFNKEVKIVKLKWKFLDNPANENEGLANSGIETFRSAPYSSIARECGQNSIDASSNKDIPVNLKFEKITVPTIKIPDLESLKNTIRQCLIKANKSKIQKEIVFFENARNILENSEVKVLKITDSGTTGIIGPCEEGTPYYALVRSTGVSEKQSNTAGGSFGIGKNATFAMSALRTVFYSTKYSINNETQFLCQGKSQLISHEDSFQNKFRGTGYCCLDNYRPAHIEDEIPSWLRISDIGASISIVGFQDDEHWEERVAESLIRNFFSSINDESVVMDVNGKYFLNKINLNKLFENKKISHADTVSGSESFNFSHSLYRCLLSEHSKVFLKDIEDFGLFKLSILVEDGLEKKVGFIRNGMYITNELSNFKDKMKRFPALKDFVAVIEPINNLSISALRSVENPKHDEFSPSRIDDLKEQKAIIKKFGVLSEWAKQVIRELTTPESKEEDLISELNDFFSTPGQSDLINNDEGEKNPETVSVEKVKVKVSPVNDSSIKSSDFDDYDDTDTSEGEGDNYRRGYEKNKKRVGPYNDDPYEGGRKKIPNKESLNKNRDTGSVKYSDLRTVSGSSVNHRIIYFTPDETVLSQLRIFTPGLSKKEELGIESVYGGEIIRGRFYIKLQSGVRNSINVYFTTEYDGPIILRLLKDKEMQDEI